MAGRGDQSASGFGESLRRLRGVKGWTQKELAEASGLHPNTVAKLERGDQEPNWPVVLKFAAALGVECTAFTSGGSDPAPTPSQPEEGKGPSKRPSPRRQPAKKKPGTGKK